MLALVIAALVAFCGHPGRRQSAERRAAPSSSTHGRAPTWAFQYVHFVTRSDGWAMADNDRSGFADLFTSHDGGRRWHDVTPPVVVASDNAWLYDSSHNLDMEKTAGGPIEEAATVQALTPFVLNSRDAWLPVSRSYGPNDQSSELYVYMTSDAGRTWARRGRFPWAGWGDIFFLNRSTGFIETGDAAAAGEEPVQIYATSDGGKHWREVSAGAPLFGPITQGGSPTAIGDGCDKNGLSFASARVGFATEACVVGATLQRTSDGGRKWGYIGIAPGNGDGGATYPPVFSSPDVGSMVVDTDPVLVFATTTDAGRHWELRHLPAGAARLISADDLCLPGCLDLVTARTWVVGAGRELYTTTDAGLSWRASYSPRDLTYLEQPGFPSNLQLDFLSPRLGWAYEGNIDGVSDARTALLWRTTDGGRHWSTYSLGAP